MLNGLYLDQIDRERLHLICSERKGVVQSAMRPSIGRFLFCILSITIQKLPGINIEFFPVERATQRV